MTSPLKAAFKMCIKNPTGKIALDNHFFYSLSTYQFLLIRNYDVSDAYKFPNFWKHYLSLNRLLDDLVSFCNISRQQKHFKLWEFLSRVWRYHEHCILTKTYKLTFSLKTKTFKNSKYLNYVFEQITMEYFYT